MSNSDDFQAEVQKRIQAQARERAMALQEDAIALEVKRQNGHYRQAAWNWLAGFIASLVAGLALFAYGYQSPTQLQIERIDYGQVSGPPGWVKPAWILLFVIAGVCLVAAILARLSDRSSRQVL